MRKFKYALLELDNKKEYGHFVVAQAIDFIDTNDKEDPFNYTIYRDLFLNKKIYPASYKADESQDQVEYEKQLGKLKWISRKKISRRAVLKILQDMEKRDMVQYFSVLNASKEEKEEYKKRILSGKKMLKKQKTKKK